MSITKSVLRKLAEKSTVSRCVAKPDGRRMRGRKVHKRGGITCGREMCGLWVLAADEDAVARLLADEAA
ncbi:MAG: hypothetical protein M3548_09740 [Actinomycetota bacterium]|nr:hypothetical protein [Actinomycetota bacterium]